jgi:uncharacterized membrane protein
VPDSTQLDHERTATSTPDSQAGVLVVRRHHQLVRCSHWLNVPILLGLILSGLSVYWASPVYRRTFARSKSTRTAAAWRCTYKAAGHSGSIATRDF